MRKWFNFDKISSWVKAKEKKDSSALPAITGIKGLKGQRVLLRASLNAPVQDGRVTELFRIEQALPTLNFLKEQGAKVVVIGHIGRESEESLKPVFTEIEKLTDITWGGNLSEAKEKVAALENGEAVLLENLRQDKRESGNVDSLAKQLAELADVYVNDAFSDSHREHASIVGVVKYLPSYFGLSFLREYEALKEVMKPESPSLFILGGAKFDTKMPLVEKYAAVYDQLFVGGALANDFFKAKGYAVGQSLVSDVDLRESSLLNNGRLMIPTDVVVEEVDGGKKEVGVRAVSADEIIYDIGPLTLKELENLVNKATTILWNGPMGNFEKGYSLGTEMLARAIAGSSAHSVVGGGDTIAAIRSLNLSEQFGFMSTAGGAMLVFLEIGTLPAIEAVKKDSFTL